VELDDKETFEISLIENVQRQTLSPIEEAQAFKIYVTDYGWGGVSDLSTRIGKSASYITKRIKLLDLPKDVSAITLGLTIPVPRNPGKTMVKGPLPTSDCFLTDNRTFSPQIDASSRMHSEIEISISGGSTSGGTAAQITRQQHRSDKTTEIDCEDGDIEGTAHGNTSRMRFSNLRSTGSKFQVSIEGAANHPLVTDSPDIDYKGEFIVDLASRTITFDGYVDEFPAFEAYASINNGSAIQIFLILPQPRKSPWNLWGPANRRVREIARF
jgi:hypothetical protein